MNNKIKIILQNFFKFQSRTVYHDQSGQVLIIILLVLVVGVSIILSLSARSITDVRTTTSTEQSNRAYFAAEAGIERALQQIKDGSVTGSTNPITGQATDLGNGAQYTGNISSSGSFAQAFYLTALKDNTVQVNLRSDITSDATGLMGGRIDIYWHTTSGPVAADTAALEITFLRKNTSSGEYSVDKFGCDPITAAGRFPADGFSCAGSIAGNNPTASCGTATLAGVYNSSINSFCFKTTLPLNATERTLLMRIRPIMPPPVTSASEGIAVEYTNSSGGILPLPQQGYSITSTGVGKDGSNRKLVVFRSYPSLPTIFDFVLYNGSNNALQKP